MEPTHAVPRLLDLVNFWKALMATHYLRDKFTFLGIGLVDPAGPLQIFMDFSVRGSRYRLQFFPAHAMLRELEPLKG